MHDQQAERIRVLESRVQRWRLVSLALMLALVSCLAIGCTFGLVLIINQDDRNELRGQVLAAREEAERALQDAQRARQEAENALHQKKIPANNHDGP